MRCVNIDWLEIYAKEDSSRYPLNADYFRSRGYFVNERDYGTRVYAEMFTVEDKEGHPFVEVRRKPLSAASSFTGLDEYSCHLRLVNRACYYDDAVSRLRDFMLEHNYIFQRIFRLDICYDFTQFDFGDRPDRVAQRIITKKYRKVNQGRISTHAQDRWDDYEWETLSWGSPTSMVSTKMYNKTKELARPKADKPYIRQMWMECGLVDDPIALTRKDENGVQKKQDVWRVEFSLKSSARNWIVIEDNSGKREKKRAIPHTLALFDSRDKLWQRFQDLAFHYFRFKIQTYVENLDSEHEKQPQRKDRCPDKKLFDFDANRSFCQIEALAPESKPDRDDVILRNRVFSYREHHADPEIRQACDIILKSLEAREIRRLTPTGTGMEIEALRLRIAMQTGWEYSKVCEKAEEIRQLLFNDEMF